MEYVLKTINKRLKGKNYHFEEYKTSNPLYPYVIGELSETENTQGTGEEIYTFFLNIFTKKVYNRIRIVEEIRGLFPTIEGYVKHSEENGTIAIYNQAITHFYTDVEGMHRTELRLKVLRWKG